MVKNFLKSHPIHKKIVPLFDLLMISRPTLFFSVWVMICIGMYIGMLVGADGHLEHISVNITNFSFKTLAIFFGISLICAATFILNQLSDVKGDKINKKIFIIDNTVSAEKALIVSRIAFALGLISIIIFKLSVLFPALLIYFFWGKLYNDQRYNWKSNPWLGFLCNIICGYLLILSGVLSVNDSMSIWFEIVNSFVYTLPFLFAYASVVLLANIPDMEGDKETNKKTFTVVYGVRNTVLLSTSMCVFSLLLGLYLWEPLSSTAALSALPFFLFATFRSQNKDILRSIRYPILLLNFYVLTIYPLLIFPVLISYYLTKYYYWHRFSIHYPTLLVDND